MEDLKARMSAIEQRVAGHDTRLARQEESLRLYAETKYVDGVIKPIETAVTKFQMAFEHITERLDSLATGQTTLNSTYNQLLRDRGDRENREHEKKIEILEAELAAARDRGFVKFVKEKFYPILGTIIALAAIIALIIQWIRYVANAPK
jgi:chromosome segregation ATPase